MQHPDLVGEWERYSSTLVLLSVIDEDELLGWADRFSGFCHVDSKIYAPWTLFYEPDITEHTALATILTPDLARKLSHLPLALKEVNENGTRRNVVSSV